MTKQTFAERCQIAEQCLPAEPYRAMLTALHTEMLAALAEQPAMRSATRDEKVAKPGVYEVPVKTYHGGKPWPVAPSDLNPEHIIRQLVTALENSGTKMRSDQWYVEIEAVAAGKRYLNEMALLGREKMDEEHRVGFDGPDED